MDYAAHVIAHYRANCHGIRIGAVDLNVLSRQVPHFTEIHAEDTGTDNWCIHVQRKIGNRVSLTVEGTEEHGGVVLHVFHASDWRPFHIFQINIRSQDKILSCISACASVIDAFGKCQELIDRRNLPRIFFRSTSTRKQAFLRHRGRTQAQCHAKHHQQG